MVHLPRRWRVWAPVLAAAVATALAVWPGRPATADNVTAAHRAVTGARISYLVNTAARHATVERVERAVAAAGGTVVTAYEQIGVIVAHAATPDFARRMRAVPGVDSAGATRTAPLTSAAATDTVTPVPLDARQLTAAMARRSVPGEDPLEPLQWDIRAIHADQAQRLTLGSPRVKVGVIDTGVDDTHPDLAPGFDRADSVSCVGGKPDTRDGAWRPYPNGGSPHGTHTAGEIAAARNGVGVVGVAPGVRIAAIKVDERKTSLFYAEAVVCGFVWAADHGIAVTNNSYYVDPWYFNCLGDPDQRALVDAVARAARYAERKGVVNVASAGNSDWDLSSTSIRDTASPDDGKAVPRTVDPHTCLDVPTQLPGVVSVSATGAKSLKASYSNYGLGVVDVAGPGGDSTTYQPPPPPAASGLILSTLPGGKYGYMAGTSMASPHVVGVLALLKSTHPWAGPAELKRLLYRDADHTPCPSQAEADSGGRQEGACVGTAAHNGFYGYGIVNALKAVTW